MTGATHQLDLFGLPGLGDHVPAAPPSMAATTPERDGSICDSDVEREDFTTLAKRGSAAIDAGQVEFIHWGPIDERGRTPHGKAGFVIRLWQDGDGWRYMTDLSLQNSWGGGPWSDRHYATRDELLEAVLLKQLESCAHTATWWQGSCGEKRPEEARKLAAWIIAQLPPLMFPNARAAERWDEWLVREKVASEAFYALLRAKHDADEKATAALQEAKRWGYTHLIVDPDAREGIVAPDRYPGRYSINGDAPDALSVLIRYDKGKKDAPAILMARDLIAAATGLPVSLERGH